MPYGASVRLTFERGGAHVCFPCAPQDIAGDAASAAGELVTNVESDRSREEGAEADEGLAGSVLGAAFARHGAEIAGPVSTSLSLCYELRLLEVEDQALMSDFRVRLRCIAD